MKHQHLFTCTNQSTTSTGRTLLLLIYKCLKNCLSLYVSNQHFDLLNTICNFIIPKLSVLVSNRTFTVTTSREWIKLPILITQSLTTSAFKKHWKLIRFHNFIFWQTSCHSSCQLEICWWTFFPLHCFCWVERSSQISPFHTYFGSIQKVLKNPPFQMSFSWWFLAALFLYSCLLMSVPPEVSVDDVAP